MAVKVKHARAWSGTLLGGALILTLVSSGALHDVVPRLQPAVLGAWSPAILTIALLLACPRRRRTDLVPWAVAVSLAAVAGRRLLIGGSPLEGLASACLLPLAIQALTEFDRVRASLRQPHQQTFTLRVGRDRRSRRHAPSRTANHQPDTPLRPRTGSSGGAVEPCEWCALPHRGES